MVHRDWYIIYDLWYMILFCHTYMTCDYHIWYFIFSKKLFYFLYLFYIFRIEEHKCLFIMWCFDYNKRMCAKRFEDQEQVWFNTTFLFKKNLWFKKNTLYLIVIRTSVIIFFTWILLFLILHECYYVIYHMWYSRKSYMILHQFVLYLNYHIWYLYFTIW